METISRYKRKMELEKIMESKRMAKTGDKVKALGHTYTIGDKIFYNDRYVEWHNKKECFIICYDIEFLDIYGGYHHWKSYDDGGELILVD